MDLKEIQPFDIGPMQRVGSKNDGGYILPLNCPEVDSLISFGLGDDSNFEIDCVKRGIAKNFIIFDHTVSVKSLFFRLLKRFVTQPFDIKAVLYRLRVLIFYTYRFKFLNNSHVPSKISSKPLSAGELSLSEIAANLTTKSFMLKIDIEGDEYEVIPHVICLAEQIPLLLIEFHHTELLREKFQKAIADLKRCYGIVHVHGNNFTGIAEDGIPHTLEITFLKRDLIDTTKKVFKLPRTEYDQPSSKFSREISLFFS
jgi:hypothetical protein